MLENLCNPETFKALFLRLSNGVRRHVYYKSGDWEGSEDIMQETFLRLWNKCKEVMPDHVEGFLHRVAENLMLDAFRHSQVRFKFENHTRSAPVAHAASPETELEDREMQEKLERALAGLTESQRVVFLMNRVDKLKYHEIAERLGISVKAVEKRMHLALLELKKLTDAG